MTSRSRASPSPPAPTPFSWLRAKSEWTIIFNKNSSAWGSFFYDPSVDALHVTVTPEQTDYFREWLTYEFEDRQVDTDQSSPALGAPSGCRSQISVP